MKKTVLVFTAAILILAFVYCIGSGFRKEGSAYIGEYGLSEDGRQMSFKTGVMSSVGYLRSVSAHTEGERLCLDFYSAFGGINGKIGARSEFMISLDENIRIIAVYRGNGSYENVLVRDDEGVWQRVSQK